MDFLPPLWKASRNLLKRGCFLNLTISTSFHLEALFKLKMLSNYLVIMA